MNACIINVWGYTEILPEAGINTRSSVVSFDSPSRLLLGAVPPRLHALRDSDFGKMASSTSESTKPPPLPPRPQTQRSNGRLQGRSYLYANTQLRT